jgi:hypothetical protein
MESNLPKYSTSPGNDLDVELVQGKDWDEFISDIVRDTRQDETARAQWLNKQEQFYRQRYCLEWRNPTFPWPNSSDVVLPLTDMIVERLKASYSALFKQTPLVSFEPASFGQAEVEKANKAGMFFDYTLNFMVNDFRRQKDLLIDSILQTGIGVAKVYWHDETISNTDKIRREDLPMRFKAIMPIRGKDSEIAATIESISAAMRGEQAAPLTVKEFNKYLKEPLPGQSMNIREFIAEEFKLDPEDRVERKSLDKLVQLIRGDVEIVKIKTRNVAKCAPRMVAVDPRDVIVPPYTDCIEDAARIAHRMYFTEHEVRQRGADGVWNQEAVDEMLEAGPTNRISAYEYQSGYNSITKDLREGILQAQEQQLYEVWEHYCYYDHDGDGLDEKVVITLAPHSKSILKARELPYKHNQWPFVGFPFELNETGFFSHRGVPERTRDFQMEITALHRGKLNRLMQETAQTWKVRAGSHLTAGVLRSAPGQMIPVQRMDDIQELQISSKSMNFQEEENVLRSWVEQYMSSTDFALNAPTSASQDSRTAREISALQTTKEAQMGIRLGVFIDGLKRVYGQMWDLWQQFGDRNLIFRTSGGDVFKATRDEIMGNYDIIPNVPVGAYDPALQAQIDQNLLMLMAQVVKPILDQDGRFKVDLGQQALELFQRMDYRKARRIIIPRSPEEMQAMEQQKQQAMQLQMAQAGADIGAKQADAASKQASAAKSMVQARQIAQEPPPMQEQASPFEALLGSMGQR